ncbi:MAG TPA: hypothetical protein VLJ61_01675, partial [Pyrinomonadaceae bacterium]|nr:hypothetical protein [Pyrinomonadaceae bacterium]
MKKAVVLSFILPPSSFLLGFLVRPVATASTAELPKLKALRFRLLILSRHVVTALTFRTLQYDVVTRHKLTPKNLISEIRLATRRCGNRDLESPGYSTISETVPAPTVLPPSRMANRNPFSNAIGVISSISIATLSPGITIS